MQRVVINTAGWIRTDVDVRTTEVQLSYDPADPLAVTISGLPGDDSTPAAPTFPWVISRDLLADGLRSMIPVGEGRVRVQATSVLTEISWDEESGAVTVLRLPWWNTREFVRLAQAAVPRGKERCDVDSWVAALTAPRDL
jgi:hypothetical protein